MTLFTITEQELNSSPVAMVNAKELHQFLESKQHYTDWLKNRIRKYGFERDVDYLLHKVMMPHSSGAKSATQCFITVDMAKELSMLEANDKGKQARRYFIECERQSKTTAKILQEHSVLTVAKDMVGLAELFGYEGNQAKLAADKAVRKTLGVSPLQLLEINLVADERLLTPTQLGKLLGWSGRRMNNQLLVEGFQSKDDLGNWIVTEKGKPFGVLLNVGKAKGDGTPVQQLKWKESIINAMLLDEM